MANALILAERKTNVEVGLVRLFKPAVSSSFDYDGFYLNEDEEPQENGIIAHNEVRAIVNSYLAAVKCFERHQAIADEMNRYTSLVGYGSGFKFNVSYNKDVVSKEDFAKGMQRQCWEYVFAKMNIQKWVTSGVMRDINEFINNRKNYPFSMKNVYRMFEVIVGTREHTMNRAIVEAIDNITKYTHENRYGLPGWKTNEGHLLNKNS